MNLRPVNSKGNSYCGPAVISAVTGISTDEAARVIRETSGVRAVRGTFAHQIEAAFYRLGYSLRPFPNYHNDTVLRPTLAAWLRRSIEERKAGRIFLVSAGHHWQLISGRRYVCGRTKQIVSIRDKQVKRRARVKSVYEIVKRG